MYTCVQVLRKSCTLTAVVGKPEIIYMETTECSDLPPEETYLVDVFLYTCLHVH